MDTTVLFTNITSDHRQLQSVSTESAAARISPTTKTRTTMKAGSTRGRIFRDHRKLDHTNDMKILTLISLAVIEMEADRFNWRAHILNFPKGDGTISCFK